MLEHWFCYTLLLLMSRVQADKKYELRGDLAELQSKIDLAHISLFFSDTMPGMP